MTRSAGFEFYECPKCGQMHRRRLYASINFAVSPNLATPTKEFKCASCAALLQLDQFVYQGREFYREQFVPAFLLDRRTSWQKLKDRIAGLVPEHIDQMPEPEWMKYPVLPF